MKLNVNARRFDSEVLRSWTPKGSVGRSGMSALFQRSSAAKTSILDVEAPQKLVAFARLVRQVDVWHLRG